MPTVLLVGLATLLGGAVASQAAILKGGGWAGTSQSTARYAAAQHQRTRAQLLKAKTLRAMPASLRARYAQVLKVIKLEMSMQAKREAAAARLQVMVARAKSSATNRVQALAVTDPALIGQGDVPDYFGPTVPNWAYTPPLTKFVDTLPVLGPGGASTLDGNYIPVAVADKTTYLDADYYEIALVQFTQRFHRDMPLPTTLRGYVQIDTDAIPDTATKTQLFYPDGTTPILDAQGALVFGVDKPRYLGPTLVAQKDRPLRIKFTNYLTAGAGGDLFIPMDSTVMGAGMGPVMAPMPMGADRVGGAGRTVEIMTMDAHPFTVGQHVALSNWKPAAYNGQFIVTAVAPDKMSFQVKLDTDPGGPATQNGEAMEAYAQNRGTIHLHGGLTPWISDGTPHQWVTPAGENTSYPAGVSVRSVPDMPDPGDGSMTFYYSNQQSARLMFYHDHVYGITRLNVYVGEAAGYVLQDPTEQDLVARNIIPDDQIPLIIQDKTFVDAATIGTTDPTWRWGTGLDNDANGYPDFKTGDLWAPHVYMPAQNPADISGMAAMGRWHYGPWFWPPTNVKYGPVPNPYYDSWVAGDIAPDGSVYATDGPATRPWEPELMPGTPDPSVGMEHYNDTPIVNGAAYPTLTVDPKAYRLRILNAANDRFFNLQLYVASSIVSGITVDLPGSGYNPGKTKALITGDGAGATASAVVDPATGAITAIDVLTVGSGYTTATVNITDTSVVPVPGTGATATANIYTAPTEVGMVPSLRGTDLPADWPTDGRTGGVPDPATKGPDWLQIGTEGGFLPAPAVIPARPATWNWDQTTFNMGNVTDHSLMLAPAERADVIVDFSQYAGQTLIVYNDAPVAFPALDPRQDYYTGMPDMRDTGSHWPTLPGFGPNVRTVMQITVNGSAAPDPTPWAGQTALETEWTSTASQPGVFERGQDPILVGQSAYDSAYTRPIGANPDKPFPATSPYWGYAHIHDTSLKIETIDGTRLSIPMAPKAIHDEIGAVYDDFGRMSGKLGTEVPGTTSVNQNFSLLAYIDNPTEIIDDNITPLTPVLGDGTQIWKFTHNGVDTHPIHFHLLNVQVINRVGWDGAIRPPDANELGWKETVRMSPLEDTIVALRPYAPKAPFGQPDSIRLLDPTRPAGATWPSQDPLTGNPITVTNQLYNYGWEYMIHCHVLSHEEMEMMRPIEFHVARALATAPVVSAAIDVANVNLTWTDGTAVGDPNTLGNPANEIGFRIERARVDGPDPGPYSVVGVALANQTAFTDTTANPAYLYSYRVVAYNVAGDSVSDAVLVAFTAPSAPTNLSLKPGKKSTVSITWTDTSTNEQGFIVQRSTDGVTWTTVATVPTNTTQFGDRPPARGATYWYQVTAFNPVGASAPTAPKSIHY